MKLPAECPKCHVNLIGDPSPADQFDDNMRSANTPAEDRFYGRVLAVVINDRADHWQCPDCGYEWR
jgi:predicted Zn-ribbon and HTH transcriptional regulator